MEHARSLALEPDSVQRVDALATGPPPDPAAQITRIDPARHEIRELLAVGEAVAHDGRSVSREKPQMVVQPVRGSPDKFISPLQRDHLQPPQHEGRTLFRLQKRDERLRLAARDPGRVGVLPRLLYRMFPRGALGESPEDKVHPKLLRPCDDTTACALPSSRVNSSSDDECQESDARERGRPRDPEC